MNNHSKEQTKLALAGDHARCLEAAILNWTFAFHKCQTRPSREHLSEYVQRCFQLGDSISRWQLQQPELVEQFRFWFRSHPED